MEDLEEIHNHVYPVVRGVYSNVSLEVYNQMCNFQVRNNEKKKKNKQR